MRKFLVGTLGFSNVQLLTDSSVTVPTPLDSKTPTGANIKAALGKMVDDAEAGDVLFFHFSGHGTLIPSLKPGEPFRLDEAIVPCDLNIITDVDFRHYVDLASEKGASFTILSDSCHSGGLIDKEKEQIGPSAGKSIPPSVPHRDRFLPLGLIGNFLLSQVSQIATNIAVQVAEDLGSVTVSEVASRLNSIFGKDVSLKFQPYSERVLELKPLKEDYGIQLSGCQADEKSADVVLAGKKPHGAFSKAVLKILEETKGVITNKELVMKVRMLLKIQGFQQHPCLYCSDQNAAATFLSSIQQTHRNKRETYAKIMSEANADHIN